MAARGRTARHKWLKPGAASHMPYSINIRSDNHSSRPIRDLWSLCAALEDQPSMIALDYPPHFTLAVLDEADESRLASAVETVSSRTTQVLVRFDRVRYFETPTSIVLWAAPSDSSKLADVHNAIHECLRPFSVRGSVRCDRLRTVSSRRCHPRESLSGRWLARRPRRAHQGRISRLRTFTPDPGQ
jgi:hypothetical protein